MGSSFKLTNICTSIIVAMGVDGIEYTSLGPILRHTI